MHLTDFQTKQFACELTKRGQTDGLEMKNLPKAPTKPGQQELEIV